MSRSRTTARSAAAAGTAVVLLLTPAAHGATAPPPVKDWFLDSRSAQISVTWTLPAGADGAEACYLPGVVAPTVPGDPATCSAISPTGARFDAPVGLQFAISVFSHSSTSGLFGSPVSTEDTVSDPDPAPIDRIWSTSPDATTLTFAWNAYDTDLTRFDIVLTRGITAAPASAAPTASVPVDPARTLQSYTATGLTPDAPYTITVRAVDRGGHIGDPSPATAATRVDGLHLVQSADGRDVRVPTGGGAIADASVTTTVLGHVRALTATTTGLVFSQRTATRTWTAPVLLAPAASHAVQPRISASSSGAIAVGWKSGTKLYYRVRPAGSTTWGATHLLSSNALDSLQGLQIDRHGRLHVLFARGCTPTSGTATCAQLGAGLYYRTDVGGTWHQQRLAGTDDTDTGALAYDGRADTLVVLDTRVDSDDVPAPQTAALLLATAPAISTRFGALTRRLSVSRSTSVLLGAQVAADSGRITVVVQRISSDPSARGLYVLTGTSAATVGHFQRVPGTTAADTLPVLSAYSGQGVVVAWLRRSATWDPAALGVWTSPLTYSGSTNLWRATSRAHVTRSSYDVPISSRRDTAGRLYTTTARPGSDISPVFPVS